MTPVPMMECGHAANATKDDDPCCAICSPAKAAHTVSTNTPDLTGRLAKCHYAPKGGTKKKCAGEVPSSTTLAFFSYHPDKPTDSFYCGCWGWD